jgi:ASPIC and UnbV
LFPALREGEHERQWRQVENNARVCPDEANISSKPKSAQRCQWPDVVHWLTITLRGKRSIRDRHGARVQVNGQVRFATTSGSYLSSNETRLHFGLGSSETANVEIQWPSGIHQTLRNIKADQFLEVEESQ